MTGLDIGLLILRVGFAALLFGHSTQKLFGWFRGGGPAGHGAVFETWGIRPGPPMAVVAGVCEMVGLLSVGFGFLTVGGCAVVIGTMVVAASPNAHNGLWAHLGGNEVPVLYGFLAVVIAFTGPGRYSLDHALGVTALSSVGWSVAAVVVGVVAALPMLVRRRAALRPQ
jgi:putative oxidoreductase